MSGFFSKKEVQSNSRPDGKIYSCASCGLVPGSMTPKMEPWGNFKKGIMIIGPGPSIKDDKKGKPFSDDAGRFLKRTFSNFGIDLEEDCVCLNAINCLAISGDSSRFPTDYEISCCRKSILKYISDYQPHLIIVLGMPGMISLIGHRWKKDMGGINKWRGWKIPDQDFKAWVCPAYEPSLILDSNKPELETVWKQDIENALNLLKQPFLRNKKHQIDIISDLKILREISSDLVAIDYETTGLKPHGPGHRIVCASVSDTADHSFVFLMPETRKERQPFLDLLSNPAIGKTAQNMKFEDTWSRVRLRTEVKGWVWDTMLGSHLLDNRPDVTGLKFQTYVQFGVIDYDSEISPYLKSSEEKNGNGINRVMELLGGPLEKKLLEYCALDTIYEYRLMEIQTKLINYSFLPF